MSKLINAVAGPVLGLLTGGGKGLLRGIGNLVTAFTGGPLAAALAIGTSLLSGSGNKKTPPPLNDGDRYRLSIDPRTPRKIAVGTTALATDIRDQEFTDSQKYLHRFIVVASHKIRAIREIWFDEKLAWTLAGGVQGEFVNWLTVTPVLEGSAANAINISPRMGSSRRYTGCAYVYLRYQILSTNKKLESPFAQSISERVTIKGDAALLYDPRLDSTVPGGSGPQRVNDQSTWSTVAETCRNPALVLLFYLIGWRINGLLAVGKGMPANRIDLESFAVAANICDETVAKTGGGTEPRYRCDGVFSEADQPTAVTDNIKACMNADLDDVGGKLRLTIFRNDLDIPLASFTEADVLGEFNWRPSLPLNESVNIVRGTFVDPSNEALFQPNDYPQVEESSPDGIDRILPLDFALVQSPTQAVRLAGLRLKRQKFAGVFKAEFQATAWKVQKNAIVSLTFAPLGFVNKLFRVAEMDHREDGVVPLTLREESPDLYDPVTSSQPINVAVASTGYDPSLSPIVQAADSADQIAISTSFPIGLTITAARTTGDVAVNLSADAMPAGVTLTRASVATYIDAAGVRQTAAANVARFDHDPVTPFASRGLLVEPQRTNLLLQSGNLSSSSWSKSNVTAASSTSFVENTATAGRYIGQNNTIVSGTTYTVSHVVAALGTGAVRYPQINGSSGVFGVQQRATFDLAAGTFATNGGCTAGMVNLGGGRWRIWMTATATASSSGSLLRLYLSTTASATTTPSYAGDGVSGLQVFHGQIEDGAGLTSRIDTTTAAVSRAPDAVTINWAGRGVADGSVTVRYTFDDNTTQDVATTIAAGSASVPPLNRMWIKQIAALNVSTTVITINNHTRRYTDGHPDVAVTGASLVAAIEAIPSTASPVSGNPNELSAPGVPTLASDANFEVTIVATNTAETWLTAGGTRRRIANGGGVSIPAGGLAANTIVMLNNSPGGAFVLIGSRPKPAEGQGRAIAYDDPDRLGGNVTYQLFGSAIDARSSPANPARHYVGYVTAPGVGDPPSTGGGAVPPGGSGGGGIPGSVIP